MRKRITSVILSNVWKTLERTVCMCVVRVAAKRKDVSRFFPIDLKAIKRK